MLILPLLLLLLLLAKYPPPWIMLWCSVGRIRVSILKIMGWGGMLGVDGGQAGHTLVAHGGQRHGQGIRLCTTEDTRGVWQTDKTHSLTWSIHYMMTTATTTAATTTATTVLRPPSPAPWNTQTQTVNNVTTCHNCSNYNVTMSTKPHTQTQTINNVTTCHNCSNYNVTMSTQPHDDAVM